MLTLVPAAAFGANVNTDTPNNGATVTLQNGDNQVVGLDSKGEAAVVMDVKAGSAWSHNNSQQLVFWVKNQAGEVVNAAKFTDSNSKTWLENTAENQWKGAWAITNGINANDDFDVTATFDAVGTYTVYAGIYDNTCNDKTLDTLIGVQKVGTVKVDYGANRTVSGYGVVENGAVAKTAEVAVGTALDTNFVVNYAAGQGTTDKFAQVTVWAEKDDEVVKEGISFEGKTLGTQGGVQYTNVSNDEPTVKVTFDQAGTYTLYAGLGSSVSAAKNAKLGAFTTVTVTDKDLVLDHITATVKTTNGETDTLTFDSNNMAKLDLTEVDPDFDYDGIDKVTINGVALTEDGKYVQGKTIIATTNKNSVIELDNNEVRDITDNLGRFEIAFGMQDKSNGTLYIVDEEGNIEYSIQVIAAKTSAVNIDRTQTGGYVLAGNDKDYAAGVYGSVSATKPVYFTDAVQFKVTDEKGQAVTGKDAIAGAKIEIQGVAKNSTLKNATLVNGDDKNDLELAWDEANGVYTLAYVGANDTGNYTKDLIPGEYTVRVALASGDNATVTFNVAKFGKVQDTVLDIHAHDYGYDPANPNEKYLTVDDQITLGQFVTVNAVYVDENGIKVDAPAVNYGFNGEAVRDVDVQDGTFITPADSAVNDSLIGTEIEVVAYNTANKQLVTKTLTVVKSYTDKTLEFGSEEGPVAKDNKVPVSVVNEDGKVQQVKGTITAWVADQSNEDAKVSVDTTNATVNSGKGSITVYSDEETTADIVVIVKAGTEVYPATLHYTFGAEDPLANRTVVMTIDSTEYVVNNNVFTGDAAPYIDDAWRTMVPIRALMEAFDSEVIWNQDDETVTINFDGDTQIVMTVGETGYTIDGVDGEMDTVPVNTGDRVYVPIRFVAEGIGFHVTPLYNADGLTASVVFQK